MSSSTDPQKQPNRTVAVIGGGLAGHAAVACLATDDHVDALHIYPPSPGQLGHWGGIGRIYGPARAVSSSRAGIDGPGVDGDFHLVRRRVDRVERLWSRRSHHPYQITDATLDELDTSIGDTLRALPDVDLIQRRDETILPAADAAPVVADVTPASMERLRLAAGQHVQLVEAPGVDGWHAGSLAEQLDRADAMRADTTEAPAFQSLDGGHPVRCAAQLDASGEAAEQLQAFLAARPSDVDLVVFPPCLGDTLEAHRTLRDALADAGPPIAEGCVDRHGTQGWRVDRALRRRQPADASASAESLDIQRGSVSGVQLEAAPIGKADDGGTLSVDAVILATGSFAHGSLRTEPPLGESITGVPLYLDGQPLRDPDERAVSSFVDDHPWADHEVWRLGVGIDAHLRIMDEDGHPLADNLFAAGRLLSGTNRIADGTAFGVDLWTGRLAARRASQAALRADTSRE